MKLSMKARGIILLVSLVTWSSSVIFLLYICRCFIPWIAWVAIISGFVALFAMPRWWGNIE